MHSSRDHGASSSASIFREGLRQALMRSVCAYCGRASSSLPPRVSESTCTRSSPEKCSRR